MTLVLPASPAGAAEPNAQAGAGYLAAAEGGATSDFELIYERSTTSPDGEALWVGKYVDLRSGELSTVYRDPDGSVAGGELLASRQAAAVAALPAFEAKSDAALAGAVAAAPATPLPMAVWLDADPTAAVAAVIAAHPEVAWTDDRPAIDDLAALRAIRGELYAARASSYEAAASAISAQVEALGGSVAYASTSAPLVFVDLPAAAASALAERAEVATMGLETTWTPQMATAGAAVQANWTTGDADQGNGARVAVVEYHNVHNTGDLAGQVVASYSTTGSVAYSGTAFDHPTWVAGAVASRNATYAGVAPGADIISSSTGGYSPSLTTDRAVVAATDRAINPAYGDADIVNTSLVQDTSTGAEEARRYFDAVAWEGNRLPVSASGNYAALGTWEVGSPGTGYNVLTVGGTDDRGTGSWTDDRQWYVPGSNGASYSDRVGASYNAYGDFNKPNVSAPAVNVITANGLGASGTSVATPIVSGIAAQLVARAPSLAVWPEALRAIITAGAIHRIPMPDGSISPDHEGAGTASALWANRILVAGDGAYGGYQTGSLGAAGTSRTISVLSGQRVRVALAWSSHTSGANLAKADTLASDLDLRVRHPNGAVVGSYTIDNSYEWVDIVALGSGQMTLEVRPARFNTTTEPYALAWAKWSVGTPVRLAGADRYATAAAVSRSFAANVPVAYIASGATFADAVAGGPAAGRGRGPLLLVTRSAIPAATADALRRLQPQRIVILGGTGSVSSSVAAALDGYTAGEVRRLAGADRYATAAAVSAATTSPGVGAVFIVTGANFPDALSAGPAAIRLGAPLLLTEPGRLPATTAGELNRLRPQQIFVIGGTGVVSSGVEAALRSYSSTVTRVAGADRFATAAAVAGRFFPSAPHAFLATGLNFPDALAAGPLAGIWGAPLLLSGAYALTTPTRGQLVRLRPASTFVLGGAGAIPDRVLSEIRALLGNV